MNSFEHSLHPVYGPVPGHGEYVQQGEVLGLSVDESTVITSPIAGWVTVSVVHAGPERMLWIRVCPHPPREQLAGHSAGSGPR